MISKGSLDKLMTCCVELQDLVKEVSQTQNICVCCGYRSREDQEAAFKAGNSKVHFPNSRHNTKPSSAVDLAPIGDDGKIDWNDVKSFDDLGLIVKNAATKLGIKIEWGGDWVMRDRPHFQLVSMDTRTGSIRTPEKVKEKIDDVQAG